MIETIKDINSLWEPVFPHLAEFVAGVFGSRQGNVAEIGPFCGVIYELSRKRIGDNFFLLSFPPGMENVYKDELKRQRLTNVRILLTNPSFENIKGDYFDFVFFRGAFFFPSIFRADLFNIMRILKKGGLALVGGGFGKKTPEHVIQMIKERSKNLNSRLGKIEVKTEEIQFLIDSNGLKENAMIIEEGGIWIALRK